MILTNRQIVWNSILGSDSLSIALDHSFAICCAKYPLKNRDEFTESIWRFMGNTLPVEPSNFLDLYQGILPRGLYAGHDGVWITLEMPPNNLKRPLMYHGHNEDRHLSDLFWLMRAFDAWASAAMVKLNWE